MRPLGCQETSSPPRDSGMFSNPVTSTLPKKTWVRTRRNHRMKRRIGVNSTATASPACRWVARDPGVRQLLAEHRRRARQRVEGADHEKPGKGLGVKPWQ